MRSSRLYEAPTKRRPQNRVNPDICSGDWNVDIKVVLSRPPHQKRSLSIMLCSRRYCLSLGRCMSLTRLCRLRFVIVHILRNSIPIPYSRNIVTHYTIPCMVLITTSHLQACMLTWLVTQLAQWPQQPNIPARETICWSYPSCLGPALRSSFEYFFYSYSAQDERVGCCRSERGTDGQAEGEVVVPREGHVDE